MTELVYRSGSGPGRSLFGKGYAQPQALIPESGGGVLPRMQTR